MTKEDLWELFKQTGDINYYLRYHEMIEGKIDILGNEENRGNNNRRKKL